MIDLRLDLFPLQIAEPWRFWISLSNGRCCRDGIVLHLVHVLAVMTSTLPVR